MAIFSSLEYCWSVSSVNSGKKTNNFTFTSTFKALPFLSLPCFTNISTCQSHVINCSTTCPSPTSSLDLQDQHQPILDTRNLNKFLCGLLQDSQTQELAYEYFKKAGEIQDFRPERSTIKLLVSYLIQSRKWDLILPIFDDLKKYNVLPDGYTCSRLVSSCIQARKIKIAESLLETFKSDSKIAVLAFESAMRSYNKLHMYSSTSLVFEKMQVAGIAIDSMGYCHIMKASHKMGDLERVVELFNEFKSRGLLDSNKIVVMQIYKIVCESLGKLGRAFEALDYFIDMRKKGVLDDDPQIYSSLICSFTNANKVNVAEELFKEAEQKGMLKDPEMFFKLVLMYIKAGQLEKSLEVINAMKRVKVRVSDCIFSAIINGYCKKRGFWAAVKVFEELRSQGCEPGQVTYASVINAYCRSGFYSEAEMVFSEMEQKGFDKCVFAYSSLISMYGKTGRVKDAMQLMAKMNKRRCKPNVWIYNSLIDMHGRAKNLKEVEKLWKEMKRRKVAPDKVTYTSMINAYNKAAKFDMCVKFYHEYKKNGGLINTVMAGIMVGVFSKLNRIDELLKLLQDMESKGTHLDERLYRSAFNALRDVGLQMPSQMSYNRYETT